MVPEAKQKLRRRRAPQEPRSSAETKGRTGNGSETVTTWLVPAAEHANAKIVVDLPIGLESSPHLRATAARHHAKTEMMAALRHDFYAACRHV